MKKIMLLIFCVLMGGAVYANDANLSPEGACLTCIGKPASKRVGVMKHKRTVVRKRL